MKDGAVLFCFVVLYMVLYGEKKLHWSGATPLIRGDYVDNGTMQKKSFQDELARLQKAVHTCEAFPADQVIAGKGYSVNPSLELLELQGIGLADIALGREGEPEPGEEMVLVWKHPQSLAIRCRPALANDLLALKLIHETIDLTQAANESGVTVGAVETVLFQAVEDGLILRAPSLLCRDQDVFPREFPDEQYRSTPVFTLQWHVTQACDLHCKHCYDRSDRVMLPFDKALGVLDDMHRFCHQNNVLGQITFTGGNPLMYPRFKDLYQAAADRGFMLAILGNPTSVSIIDEIVAVQQPEFYQVSLEGLAAHNDAIRGEGHYQRIMDFLKILQQKQIYSMVMLTLTQANYQEVIPLAEQLRDKADLFVFNRLTLFGEGAALKPVEDAVFEGFLKRYQEAAKENPVMAFKDNLFNRLNHCASNPLFGGCAGFGCGAAFNFVSLLPDGEVHACRKLPSFMGNIFERSLQDIYRSEKAKKYRAGSAACADCSIKIACRGCLAVVAGHGLDPFVDRDPYCPGIVSMDEGN